MRYEIFLEVTCYKYANILKYIGFIEVLNLVVHVVTTGFKL